MEDSLYQGERTVQGVVADHTLFLERLYSRLVDGARDRWYEYICLRDKIGRRVVQDIRIDDGGECGQANQTRPERDEM